MEMLPRLPEEMEIIELHKGRLCREPRKFKVRVFYVRRALNWLKKHNPAYFSIEISENKMQRLEQELVNGQMVIPRMEVPKHIDLFDNQGNMGDQADLNSARHDSEKEETNLSTVKKPWFMLFELFELLHFYLLTNLSIFD